MRGHGRRRLPAAAAALVLPAGLLWFAGPAGAQVASGSTAALGMAENYTAVARGFDAVAWNPAGLGLRGTGGSSFAAMVARGGTGIGPVTLSDLADWSDEVVPAGVKSDWLARITRAGGESGSADADVTWLGLQIGRFAVHASSSVRAEASLGPGITELVLFGNVGRTGTAEAISLGGSRGLVTAHSAIGASWAYPLPLAAGGRLAVGATAKWTVGHALAWGDNSTGGTTADPISVAVDFPAVASASENDAFDGNGGSGFGLDLGIAWDSPGGLSLGLTVRNVVSTFEWDTDELRYHPLRVRLDGDTAWTDTEEMPFGAAPAALRARVADLGFGPVVAAGVAWRASPGLLLAGDLRIGDDAGIRMGTARHVGAGLEFRPVPWLPIRAGAAAISGGEGSDGWQAGGGIGLDLGIWNLAWSVMHRDADRLGAVTSFMLTLFGTGR